jgi:hypothetical protein
MAAFDVVWNATKWLADNVIYTPIKETVEAIPPSL